MKKITIIIPVYNEEKGIGEVLSNIPKKKLNQLGFSVHTLVVNNSSTDNTVQVAEQFPCEIINERNKGKGYALKTGLEHANGFSDYIVVIDGDDTYKPQEIPRLIEPIDSGFCDAIMGSRIGGKSIRGSLSPSHRIANWVFAFLVRHFYLANITDTLSGFFAMKQPIAKELLKHLNSYGFAVEMEIITKLRKMGYSIYSVPVTYDRRLGESKIHSFIDGLKILRMFIRNLVWTPEKKSLVSRMAGFVTNLFI